MSYLLTEPSAVLVVGGSPSAAADVRAALSEVAAAVHGVGGVDRGIETLRERDDVGVVVVVDEATEASEGWAGPVDLAAACARLGDLEDSDRRPVVVYADLDRSAVARATRTGDVTYVEPGDEAGLAEAAASGLERYERRRRERAESSMFSTLLSDIGVSVYVKDRAGRHLRLSNTPGGPDPEEAIGRTDEGLYGDEDGAAETTADDRRVIEEGTAVREKLERFEVAGDGVWTRTTKVPWRRNGTIEGLVGLSLDVTDEVTKERQIERFEERFDRFASHLSHDLRTPLQAAAGGLELARETDDEAPLETVADAVERMGEMLDDITERAREGHRVSVGAVDGGERADAPGPEETVSLCAVVDDVWSVLGTGEATLDRRLPGGATVTAPESAVRPPIENLLRNAVHHAGPGVTVEIGALDDRSGFYVADDGPGVPPTEREAVFEEGYTTREDGTGTGLSIVAEGVEGEGWTIDLVESAAGGARFEVGNCPLVVEPGLEGRPTGPVELTDGDDVGGVHVAGSSSRDPGTGRWTVEGAGANVWHRTNEFHYVTASVDGPVRITGRVVDPPALSEYSKATLMIRDDLDADAAYGAVGVTRGHGTELLWRPRGGEVGVSLQFEEPADRFPWYRVERVGDVVTCRVSSDGEEWLPVDQRRIELTDPVRVGLGVCSFVSGLTCEATFADVSVERLDVD